MRSPEACLLKAAEQEQLAAQAPEGPIRDAFLKMADDWQRLARAKPPLINLWG